MAVVIFGMGGHGHDIAHDIDDLTVFYDDRNPAAAGTRDDWIEDRTPWLVGINDPRARMALASLHPAPPLDDGRWIHSAASVGPAVTIGRHTHINAGATITRTTVGNFTTISPNATICGDVTIGDGVTIGAGAVVSQFSVIGSFTTIGAGAVLRPHTVTGAGETWIGVPARPHRAAA